MNLAVSIPNVTERLFIDDPLYELTPTNFALEIERVVKETKCNYLDAVCQMCEKYEIDYTSVPRLLTETMKDKIEVDAEALNLLKK